MNKKNDQTDPKDMIANSLSISNRILESMKQAPEAPLPEIIKPKKKPTKKKPKKAAVISTLATTETVTLSHTLAGEVANEEARKQVFQEFRSKKSKHTITRQDSCLRQFSEFLPGDPDLTKSEGWTGVTWGLIKSFQNHLLDSGYATSTVNVRLSTLKTYAKLAYKSGVWLPEEYLQAKMIEGFSKRESINLDSKRKVTRIGNKKAAPNHLTPETIQLLKDQPSTPAGIRDRLLITLLSELGLRISEVHSLTRDNFDLDKKQVTFYRSKVNLTQTHNLNGVTPYLTEYLKINPEGDFWITINKHGHISEGWTIRGMKKRIQLIGKKAGIDNLSAHDFRHAWATLYIRPINQGGKGKTIHQLKEAGGWSNYTMPGQYIKAAEIANE